MDNRTALEFCKDLAGKLLQTIMETAYGPGYDREISEPELALMKVLIPACTDYGLAVLSRLAVLSSDKPN